MNLPAAAVWLQAQPQPLGGGLSMLVPMALIFMIFYLLLIRPQQKQKKQHEAMLKAIEKGAQVVTAGGLHGKVTGVTDDVLTLEIAALKGERVRIKVSRAKIDSVEKKSEGS